MTPNTIVTLTANPSIDRTVTLGAALERGGVIRAESQTDQAGGKGVNIARAAVAAGVPTVAVLPCDPASSYVAELHAAGINCHAVPRAGDVRVNLTLTEPDGTTTKINSAGAAVDQGLLGRIAQALHDRATSAAWVVLAGSLPPGAPDDWYADVAEALRTLDVRVAIDTSDAALSAVAARLGGVRPDLLKPNAEELTAVTGMNVESVADAVTASRALVGKGAGTVLATLGAHGAVVVDADGAWHAQPQKTRVVSTVGAGDSSLFGYLLGELRGAVTADRLRLAVAYGSAAAGLPGTTIPAPDQVHPELVDLRRLY